MALLSALVLVVTGYGWRQYNALTSGLDRSHALDGLLTSGAPAPGVSRNILIMGLDSRLDQDGRPLPKDVLDQLHAGDSSDGGYNTNVLMLLHVPGDGSKASAISIPRDDYVSFPGRPDGVAKQKIKQAYGLAKDQRERELREQGVTDPVELEHQGREAGRHESIATVQQFLGGVPIDNFVEVTLVGFYDLAQAMGSVTVCLAGPTQDSYSGARFVKGYQQLNASQALAFVRQRRDYVHPELNFTDLDRARRQQAFLASAAHQLRSVGTLTDPSRLSGLIDVAKKDVVIDEDLDLLGMLQQSQGLVAGNITFTTLPVKSFGKVDGQDVNLVDLDQIRSLVRTLLGDGAGAAPGAPPVALPPATMDVVNASGRDGVANTVLAALGDRGLTRGTASTRHRTESETVLSYAPDAADSATAVAALLGGIPVKKDAELRKGHERLVIGTDFSMPAGLSDPSGNAQDDSASGSAAHAAAPAVPASSINGGGIPCVK
ncbi:LCP family protein [Pseudonocardia spinosispora]|uniref:LCP family protein n=1 Tax=Pseudonocardia spinosispora TaxID=103441 RepID=UPI001FDEF2FE|nr:LCP family protein [Pseudonocardia spinosispora]